MAVAKIVQNENPIIHRKSIEVNNVRSDVTKRIIEDLVDTMRHEDLVGMAAPQIGENVRIFVSEIRETEYRKEEETDILRIFINPRVISVSETFRSGYEGCGSISSVSVFGQVKRPDGVTVSAYDENGEEFELAAGGLLGRVIQHEIDHLDGKLFPERMEEGEQLIDRDEYLKKIRN